MNHAGACVSGYAAVSSEFTRVSTAPESPMETLRARVKRVRSNNEGLSHVAERLEAVADAMFGAVPQSAQTPGPNGPLAGCFATDLDDATTDYGRILARLQAITNRMS